MAQETIRLSLGEVEVPLAVVQELLRRHVLRSLRLTSNGHAAHAFPAPVPEPEPEPAPAGVPGASLDDSPGPAEPVTTPAGAP